MERRPEEGRNHGEHGKEDRESERIGRNEA
jgi:hypothetical protein